MSLLQSIIAPAGTKATMKSKLNINTPYFIPRAHTEPPSHSAMSLTLAPLTITATSPTNDSDFSDLHSTSESSMSHNNSIATTPISHSSSLSLSQSLHSPSHSHQSQALSPSASSISSLTFDSHSYTDTDSGGNTCLFVGDLSKAVTDSELLELFETVGPVKSIDIKRDRQTLVSLGYAFVTLSSHADATVAKTKFNGLEHHGRKLRLGWAQQNTTLFVGDLDGSVTSDELRAIFRVYGELIDEESFVKTCGKYGFVRFTTRADAERAKFAMQRQVIGRRAIRIGWSEQNIRKCCIHVTNIDLTHAHKFPTESALRQLFSRFGAVTSLIMPRQQNRHQHFAIIYYDENEAGEQSAAAAVSTINNSVVDGVRIGVCYSKRNINGGNSSGCNSSSKNSSSWCGSNSQDYHSAPRHAPHYNRTAPTTLMHHHHRNGYHHHHYTPPHTAIDYITSTMPVPVSIPAYVMFPSTSISGHSPSLTPVPTHSPHTLLVSFPSYATAVYSHPVSPAPYHYTAADLTAAGANIPPLTLSDSEHYQQLQLPNGAIGFVPVSLLADSLTRTHSRSSPSTT